MILTEQDISQIWADFQADHDGALRNQLMEYYLPLVKATAERISAKLPSEVDVDDLISAGIFGLIDAIEAFDLDRGVKFETYCSPRIRGAILDELRNMDWVPRLVRSRAHQLENVTKILRTELGRLPTEDEIAEKLAVGKAEFDKIIRDANAVSLVSLSRKRFDEDSDRELQEIDILEDVTSSDPVAELQQNEVRNMVMNKLTKIERLVVVLYYYEQMTMKEIGATLNLSESRVSQMHTSIINRLRHQLKVTSPVPQIC